MIKSFKNKCTEDIYNGHNTKNSRILPIHLHESAFEKLDMINSSTTLDDLKIPPGNRLELLKGNLKGKYSIRINNQWRIVFFWKNGHAEEVEIIDYH